MATVQSTWVHPQGTILGVRATRLFLSLAPALTIAALAACASTKWLAGPLLVPATLAALLAWSPLFFSLPALLTQDARDAALDHWRGPLACLARGVVLIPYLACSPRSPIRIEIWLSLLGFAAAIVLAFALII